MNDVIEKTKPPVSDIEQERALLDFAVAHSPAIFYVAEFAGDNPVRFISSNVEAITGHKPASFIADPLFGRRHVHGDDLDDFNRALKLLKRKRAISREYRFKTTDGRYLWFRDELRVSADKPGAEFVGCMVEITAEKQNAEKLREAEGLNAEIIRSALDAIVTFDDQGTVIEFNPAAEKMCGYKRDKALGRKLATLIIPSEMRKKHRDGLARFRETGTARFLNRRLEVEVLRADGSRFPVEFTVATAELGERTVFIGEIRDITERLEGEIERERLTRLMRDAIEALPNGFSVTGADGRLVMCNRAFAEPLKTTPEKLIGLSRSELVRRYTPQVDKYDGQPVTGTRADLKRILGSLSGDSKDPIEMELKNGDWRLLTNSPTSEGGYVTVRTDITRIKRAEAERERLSGLLREAVRSAPSAFAVTGPDGRLVVCNDAFARLFGVPAEKLAGQDKAEVFAILIGKVASFEEKVSRSLEMGDLHGWMTTGTPAPVELEMENGEWALLSCTPTPDGGFVTVLTDVTALKKAETATRDSEAMIRRVLEACPAPIGMMRVSDGQIIYESPALRDLVGREKSDGKTNVLEFYVDPNDRKRLLAEVRRTGSVDRFEVQLKRLDGSEFWCAISSRLIEFQGEDVIVSITEDLTEEHAVEAEMARQREALHQSEKLSALGEVLAGVAHELNNPLSVVVGQALMLQETTDNPKNAERARKIGVAADRCARIVKTFLAMAREEPAESRPVDLNEVVEAALEVTGYSLRASDVSLSLRLARTPPMVTGDPAQLDQVLTNLLVNALQALESTTGDRKIMIRTSHDRRAGQIVLKIADNGPGIPGEMRSRVFDPLFTTKAVGAGTGLGLALCHRIVEAHGGRIRAESAPGKGAAFIIRFPAAKSEERGAAVGKEGAAKTGGVSALVVDDEADVAEILADVLSLDGHRVEIAHSGNEALDKLAGTEFDVIFSDLRMPGLDGPGLFREMQARYPALLPRLAFVTGDTMSPRVREFLKSADRPCIEKPISPTEVRALVERLTRANG